MHRQISALEQENDTLKSHNSALLARIEALEQGLSCALAGFEAYAARRAQSTVPVQDLQHSGGCFASFMGRRRPAARQMELSGKAGTSAREEEPAADVDPNLEAAIGKLRKLELLPGERGWRGIAGKV